MSARASAQVSQTREILRREKENLIKNNQRFEEYIIRVREQEALDTSTEIHSVREYCDQELSNARLQFDRQLADARNKRDSLAGANRGLEREIADLDKEIERLKQQIVDESKQAQDLEDRNDQATRRLEEVNANYRIQRNKLSGLQRALEIEKESSANLSAELEGLGKRDSDPDLEAENERLQAELDRLNEEAMNKLNELRDKVHSLIAKKANIEQEIRAEFTPQLQEALAERQRKYEEEKERLPAEIKELYSQKASKFRNELERYGHEIESLKLKVEALRQDKRDFESEAKKSIGIRQSMENRIKELEAILQEELARPDRLASEKDVTIRKLNEILARKNAEFDRLMDTKVKLTEEIERYRALLDSAEAKLGAADGRKRARVTKTTTTTTTSSSSNSSIATRSARKH